MRGSMLNNNTTGNNNANLLGLADEGASPTAIRKASVSTTKSVTIAGLDKAKTSDENLFADNYDSECRRAQRGSV